MFKFFLKGIIFVIGIQSLIGKLQTEGIVTGSIKINYPVLQEKIVSIIKSEEVNGLVKKFSNSSYLSPAVAQAKERQNNKLNRNYKHIVRQGETLSNLAQIYGVPWKVIKRVNHIVNERRLQIGQQLIIPTKMA